MSQRSAGGWNGNSHQLSIGSLEEQLLPIAPPPRQIASSHRQLPLPSVDWDRLDVYLVTARFNGNVYHPTAVRRELAVVFPRRSLHERIGLRSPSNGSSHKSPFTE